jgi:hypothetical protein
MDDRSELFASLTESVVYIPDGQSLDALESLRLATYSYDTYLSKPKHNKHSIVIPS